ncbi:MAG: 30S ribosomal protein S17, partial [Candidatus Riesia sp.]|nr:30S ribosomal protein S17 [Candidatus Riesia sp.]
MIVLSGNVYSNKMNKTIIVKISRKVKHKKYKKYINKSTSYFIHDENNSCKNGDLITFKETAQISKKKKW